MEVGVRIFSGLEKFLPDAELGRAFTVYVAEGTTCRELIRQLKIPADQIFTMFINGRHATLERVLQPGDQVALFPPMGGG